VSVFPKEDRAVHVAGHTNELAGDAGRNQLRATPRRHARPSAKERRVRENAENHRDGNEFNGCEPDLLVSVIHEQTEHFPAPPRALRIEALAARRH
jgi:hypothetical protein